MNCTFCCIPFDKSETFALSNRRVQPVQPFECLAARHDRYAFASPETRARRVPASSDRARAPRANTRSVPNSCGRTDLIEQPYDAESGS